MFEKHINSSINYFISFFNNKFTSIFDNKERSLLAYSANITLFSPLSNLYQLCRLHSKPFVTNSWRTVRIYPQQVLLRYGQLHGSIFIKDNISPYLMFGVVGILQGAIYGQASIYFANQMKISNKLAYRNIFNGFGYAFIRDTFSQGIPFFASSLISNKMINFIGGEDNGKIKWVSIVPLSVISTYLSHPFHNCQLLMQVNPEMNHISVLQKFRSDRTLLWKGAESRIALLLITNIFNELYLKEIL